jgi:hypothetical protein
MDLFADIGENSALELIAVLLLMAIWGGAVMAVDYWVWSDRNDERQPGMRCLTTGLSSPFVDLVVTTAVRSEWGLRTRSCTAWRVGSPPPQGPSLRSGL